MIYATVNPKGGVGKSTIALHLAVMLSHKSSTLLLDGDDPQQSAASWAQWRREGTYMPSPTTAILNGAALLTEGKILAQKFENTVIDAGARDTAGLRAALLLAERVIVPIGASSLDAAALTDLLEIAEMAKDLNPRLDLRILLSRIDPRTRDANEMVEHLKKLGLTLLTSRICERVAYRRAIRYGSVVSELKPIDMAAINEMQEFFTEITA